MSTDFSNVKIRCSAFGALMTEPQSKADKDAGELSATAKDYLAEVYGMEKYNRKEEISNKYLKKGVLVEEDSIDLLSLVDKTLYVKNEERLENDFIAGTPDAFIGDSIKSAKHIIDVKSSWSLKTFLSTIGKPLNKQYFYQLQCYMWLSGATEGTIAYCLVSAPDSMVLAEKSKLLYSMDVISEESPEYKEAAQQLEYNMCFDDIPKHERVYKINIKRDDEIIETMKQKVLKARQYLANFEKLHLKL
jgi:hypothetical protein